MPLDFTLCSPTCPREPNRRPRRRRAELSSVKLPDPFTSRGATVDDARTVLDIANAAALHDTGEIALDLDDVLTAWASPTLDPAVDAILVFEGDRAVACGEIDEERADIDVHPDVRGRGLGFALTRWSEDRARARGAGRIGQTVLDGLDGIQELFVDRGYERLWESWVLVFPPDYTRPDVAVRSDDSTPVELREYRAHDERAMYEVIDAAFSEWPDRASRPFEDWQRQTTQRSIFDPTLAVVAVDGTDVVGAAVGVRYETEGFIDQVAVAPTHRNRGIARALILRVYDEFRSRGEETIRLNTDSRTGALQLYLDIGMVLETTFVRWSLPLDSGA